MRRVPKILLIVLLSLLGLLMLAAATVCIALFTPVRDRLANRFAAQYVEGTIHTDRLRLKLAENSEIGLYGLSLTDSTGTRVFWLDSLELRFKPLPLIHSDIQAAARLRGLGLRSLDFLHLPESKDSTSQGSVIPKMDVALSVDDTRLSYGGLVRDVDLSLEAEAHSTAEGHLTASAGLNIPRVSVRDGAQRFMLRGLDLSASVDRLDSLSIERRREEFRRAMRERRRSHPRPDSLRMPDFLREESFRAADIDVSVDSSLARTIRRWNPSVRLSLDRALVVTPAFPLRNRIDSLDLSFDLDSLDVRSLSLRAGTTDLRARGGVGGLRRALFGRGKGLLRIGLDAQSDTLNLNELLAALDAGTRDTPQVSDAVDDEEYLAQVTTDSLADAGLIAPPGLLIVPANIIADVTLGVGHARVSDYIIDRFSSSLSVRERGLHIRDLSARTPFGELALYADYSTRTKEDIRASANVSLKGVTSGKVLAAVPSLDSTAAILHSIGGSLDLKASASSMLDTLMNPVLPTLKGDVKLITRGLSMPQTESMQKITRLLLFKERDSLRIGRLSLDASIKGDRAVLEPFRIDSDRYSLAFEGGMHLDGPFDCTVSLLEAPLLPFRFGVRLYGNDFEHLRWRLCRSAFDKDTELSYEEKLELDLMTLDMDVEMLVDEENQALERELEGLL